MATPINARDHLIVITRTFNAPRQLVWDVWTQAAHIAQWWGPEGMKVRVETQDFRTGGHYRYVMIAPNGMEFPAIGTFNEVIPPEKIVASDDFGEEYHQFFEAAKFPAGVTMTITFEEVGEETKLTMTMAHETEADKAKHEAMNVVPGWNSSFNKLEKLLETLG